MSAKGYKPVRTLYKLDFSGTDLDGLEVDVRRTTVGGLLDLAEMGDRLEELQLFDEKADQARAIEMARKLFAPLAKVIVAWNVLDDDDEPVPASLDGLLSQELDFIGSLLSAYLTSMSQAPPPLPGASDSGETSQAELTAAAELSRSLPSS